MSAAARLPVNAAQLYIACSGSAILLACLMAANARADTAAESVAVHGQVTYVEQETDGFHAPYAGPNSLLPDRGRETVDATLALGMRPWRGAELWLSPEVDQGFGLSNTLGLAGFSSGEAYKVGKDAPYLRLPRAYLRQTFETGGEEESLDSAANQLAGTRRADRWVPPLGKFSVTDLFDNNQYAHDPHTDFLNWTAIDSATFDYAADAWGYTAGLAIERYLGSWTYRTAAVDLSNVPNSEHLDPGFHKFQMIGEIEHHTALLGEPGSVRLTGYDSRSRMGLLDSAIALGEATGSPPDASLVRQYRSRIGFTLGWEQSLSDAVALFGRLGKSAGNVETYEFTDVDRSVLVGSSIRGAAWSRPADTLGIAAIDNGISGERERYLALGGLGILVGDGRLPHPGAEQILESYYRIAVTPWASLSLDYQFVRHPGYNTDRGPVSIFAVRVHAQF